MEDNKKNPVSDKNLKKPSGKSVTGKPLDGIEIRPQLKDKNAGPSNTNEGASSLTNQDLFERKALTLAQRQKRARILRAKEPKLQRAKEISKRKMASQEKLQARAIKKARDIVKKRYAARRGTPYEKLTTAEKIQVDTKVANKVKLIKKIAQRLLPKVRKAEYQRLKSFTAGKKLDDLSTKNVKTSAIMPKLGESFDNIIKSLDNKTDLQLVQIIDESAKALNNSMGITLKRMLEAVVSEDATTTTLLKKSEKTGIPFSTLREVFERGVFSWEEDSRLTQEQFAFNRVHSYIGRGRAWKLDADLREEKPTCDALDSAFNALTEKQGLWDNIHAKRERIKRGSGERMRKPGSKGAPTAAAFRDASESVEDQVGNKIADTARHGKVQYVGVRTADHKETGTQERQEVQYVKRHKMHTKKEKDADPQQIRIAQDQIKKKVIDEGEMKPYVKPHIEKGSTKQTAWVASNKWGKKKYFGMDFKKSAEKHAGLAEDTPSDREVGTKSLVKKYQKETPGQEKADLNEMFNIEFAAGIGVGLTANECGIHIKPGFEMHPDVVEEERESDSDYRMVKVRTPKGWVWRKVRKEADIERDAE